MNFLLRLNLFQRLESRVQGVPWQKKGVVFTNLYKIQNKQKILEFRKKEKKQLLSYYCSMNEVHHRSINNRTNERTK